MTFVNPIIRILIISDFFILFGLGFFNPILAVFITDRIDGGNVQIAGFAAAIYFAMWIFQIPIGRYLDKNHGDVDDFWFLFSGAAITSIVPFLYLFTSQPWHIYSLQALLGLGRAIDLPPWYALFTRRIDKTKEGFDWSLENVVAGAALAGAGALGGTIAKFYGFETVFIVSGILSIIGSAIILFLYKYIRDYSEK